MNNLLRYVIYLPAMLLCFFSGLSYSPQVAAKNTIVEFPFVTGAQMQLTDEGGWIKGSGTLTFGRVKISASDSDLDALCEKCSLAVNDWLFNGKEWVTAVARGALIQSQQGYTVRDFINKVNKKFPSTFTIKSFLMPIMSYDKKPGVCVALTMNPTGSSDSAPLMKVIKNWSEFDASTGGGNCYIPAPANVSCTFKNSNISFEFGSLTKSSASGGAMTKDFVVACTDSIDFKIRTANWSDSIDLSNGMSAALKLNTGKFGDVIKGVKGDNSFSLTSRLEGTPDTLGAFSGSTIMIIEYN